MATWTGTGTPQAVTATSSGSASKGMAASGTPQADTATASGSGIRNVSGSGTPQAVTATVIGSNYTGEGNLIQFEQDCWVLGDGSLITFKQDVSIIGSGNVVQFEQVTNSPDTTGTMITFRQVCKYGDGKFKGLILS